MCESTQDLNINKINKNIIYPDVISIHFLSNLVVISLYLMSKPNHHHNPSFYQDINGMISSDWMLGSVFLTIFKCFIYVCVCVCVFTLKKHQINYRSVYNMSFHPLPDNLECTRLQVEANSSRWKFGHGQWMSTRLNNEMDAREGHAYYKCGICNDTSHNRKTCPNLTYVWQYNYMKNMLGYIIIFLLSILNLSNFTSITNTIT